MWGTGEFIKLNFCMQEVHNHPDACEMETLLILKKGITKPSLLFLNKAMYESIVQDIAL